jgi:hypothetical protein
VSAVHIDRLAIRVDGLSAETVRLAMDGLSMEILARLSVRGLDAARLQDVSPSVRLPQIDAGSGLDAESLRARIAQGLVDWLAGQSVRSADHDVTEEIV